MKKIKIVKKDEKHFDDLKCFKEKAEEEIILLTRAIRDIQNKENMLNKCTWALINEKYNLKKPDKFYIYNFTDRVIVELDNPDKKPKTEEEKKEEQEQKEWLDKMNKLTGNMLKLAEVKK